MKKILCLLLSFCIFMIFCGCNAHNNDSAEYSLLRIHIRADSNDDDDQAVKMLVKEAVTNYLTGALDGVNTFDEAYGILEKSLDEIESRAEEVLTDNGFFYGAEAELNNEFFPTRAYENVVVESGFYDALIINLGSGKGDNWWCVIYPPLCFVSTEAGEGFKYKSKIKELWDKYVKGETA